MAARFPIDEVRPMGRSAYGVKAVSLEADDHVVSAMLTQRDANSTVLTVTEKGFGKRSALVDYRLTHRGAKGVIDIKTTERNGQVVGNVQVTDGEDVMIITNKGMLIRTSVGGISVIGRNTQGVKLINLSAEDEKVVSITRLPEEKEAEGGEEPGPLDDVPEGES
jgi:DNA gyrase subunit A